MPETRQHRRRRIRRTVAVGSLAVFAVAWGAIAGGGSMGATSAARQPASAVQRAQQSDDGWAWSDDGGQSTQSQQQLPDLTTRQS